MPIETIKEVTNKINKAVNTMVKGFTHSRSPKDRQGFQQLLNTATRHLGDHLREIGISEDICEKVSEGKAFSNEISDWSKLMGNVSSEYTNLYNRYNSLTDEMERMQKIHVKAQWTAIIFRVLTTLLVGLTIMGIYALAHYIGIPMPLMKLPTP